MIARPAILEEYMTNKELAEKIAIRLCTTYRGEIAGRVVLMVGKPERDMGGRCYKNVIDSIEDTLERFMPSRRTP